MIEKLRLQVALAQLGVASRRSSAEIIKSGRVKVNSRPILEPGYRVDIKKDAITIDGQEGSVQNKAYLMLNKPSDVVVTLKDRHAKHCVLDLIDYKAARVYPVGRLDQDTTGLLLLTNDGELAYRLTHPKFGVEKIYQVKVKGCVSREQIKGLASGIVLEGKKTFPCRIKPLKSDQQQSSLEVTLTEGRKRQIKKMFALAGHPVISIHRIKFAGLTLGNLKPGQRRELTAQEINKLKEA